MGWFAHFKISTMRALGRPLVTLDLKQGAGSRGYPKLIKFTVMSGLHARSDLAVFCMSYMHACAL